MSQPRQRDTSSRRTRDRIRFFYENDGQHAIVHVSGMYGGPTPKGEIYVAFFSDHAPIPEDVTHAVENGRMGRELSRTQRKEGIARTINSEIIMSVETAISFRAWLDDKIKTISEFREETQEQDAATSD